LRNYCGQALALPLALPGAGPALDWIIHHEMVAPALAVFEGWAPPLMVSGDVSQTKFRPLGLVYQHGSSLAVGVVAIAAPRPLLWFESKAALDGIGMHVAEFLESFLLREDNEIVKARLPDASMCKRSAPK